MTPKSTSCVSPVKSNQEIVRNRDCISDLTLHKNTNIDLFNARYIESITYFLYLLGPDVFSLLQASRRENPRAHPSCAGINRVETIYTSPSRSLILGKYENIVEIWLVPIVWTVSILIYFNFWGNIATKVGRHTGNCLGH